MMLSLCLLLGLLAEHRALIPCAKPAVSSRLFQLSHKRGLRVDHHLAYKSRSVASSRLFSTDGEEEDEVVGYTRKQILKEETEAPFRSIRYFLYISLTAAAGLATFITGTSLIAVSNGLREGDIIELQYNLAINILGLPFIAYFWRRDIKSQNALLERINKGGKLAGLRLKIVDEVSGDATVVKLSDLRRGRGIDKRVIIVAAPRELLESSCASAAKMHKSMVSNDLMIVPVVIKPDTGKNNYTILTTEPKVLVLAGAATTEEGAEAESPPLGTFIGQAVGTGSWNSCLKNEFKTALKQNPLALEKGITLIIKKNGKVGTRRFGVPIWESITNDVESRTAAGLDVSNI